MCDFTYRWTLKKKKKKKTNKKPKLIATENRLVLPEVGVEEWVKSESEGTNLRL